MTDWLSLAAKLGERLSELSRTDPKLRALVLELADALRATAGPTPVTQTPPTPANGAAPASPPPPPPAPASPPAPPTLAPPPWADPRRAAVPVDTTGFTATDDDADALAHLPEVEATDLPPLARRSRVKADACRWVGGAAGDIAALRQRAKADAADLWMAPTDTRPVAPADWETLGACFDNLAAAAEVVREALRGEAEVSPKRALMLLAEAQSALRVAYDAAPAALRAAGGLEEPEQKTAFAFLRRYSKRHVVYLERYMRLGDPAIPADHARLRKAIDAAHHDQHRARRREAAIKKVSFHAEKLSRNDDPLRNWQTIASALDGVVPNDLPPSDRRLREVLRRVLGTLPPGYEAPEHLRLVLTEAERAAVEPVNGHAETPRGPTVREVVDAAAAARADALAFALNSASQTDDNPFEDTDRLAAALEFLATTYRDAKRGLVKCPDLDLACRQACGFWYAPHQSEVTIGQYRADYEATFEGRRIELRSHLGRGNDRDARHAIRVGFVYDEPSQRVVVGYIGQHQRNTST